MEVVDVSDQQQYDEAEQGQQQERAEPGWVAAGSDEDAYQAQLGEVVARHHELADFQYAQQALATAGDIAAQIGDESLAAGPTILEISHILIGQQAQAEAGAQAQQPVDAADEILDSGPRSDLIAKPVLNRPDIYRRGQPSAYTWPARCSRAFRGRRPGRQSAPPLRRVPA
jgi:hypothetical protein